ncbi:hypothetical protein [Rhizobium oryzicola]|uniref:Lipoprotein n=1 Tax=Rhizobium oryzicola TaxID=1232668 RepID=A0ABT8SVG1_9HYPH|nr:hypothetical protein [Rhizobium oryzicola]MDO1582405.1 hypothetical protein [Rhizobium oryzicola]
MAKRAATIVVLGISLASCQTSATYEPLSQNPENFEVAKAKCQLLAQSSERSVVAFGTPTYVNTVQIVNSLDNAVRSANVFETCMRAQGWRQSVAQPAAAPNTQKPKPPTSADRQKAIYALALVREGQMCGLPLKGKAATSLVKLIPEAPHEIRAEFETLATTNFRDKSEALGREKTCSEIRNLLELLEQG